MTEMAISVDLLNYEIKEGGSIKDISFSFTKGGIHGILSPFGVDASLTLELLSGIRQPDSASLSLDGQAVDVSSVDWKKKIGYVPKAPEFYRDLTVYELLDFVGEARGVSAELRLRQIEEALELVGLDGLAHRLVCRLSEGEKKRLSLAAALLGNPSILLFDTSTPEFFDLIRMLGKHKTVILSSGDFEVMRELCEDVVILSDGALLASGTFSELEAQLARSEEKQSLAEVYASVEELSKENSNKRSSILSREEMGR
ncbi:MAG: ABC transporter ATP-binding protein [Clostridia bacterium]|nr:ABC transporter ATP-binding protein [Clostridia bacterium]